MGNTQSAVQERDCFVFMSMAKVGLDCTEALNFQAPWDSFSETLQVRKCKPNTKNTDQIMYIYPFNPLLAVHCYICSIQG